MKSFDRAWGWGKGKIQQERKRGRIERGEGVKGGCEKGDRRGEEKGKRWFPSICEIMHEQLQSLQPSFGPSPSGKAFSKTHCGQIVCFFIRNIVGQLMF